MKNIALMFFLLWFSAGALLAQRPAGSSSPDAGGTVVPVRLGQSVIALYGPWKFHIGDNPHWADPG
ncbi:MAG TPA: hypothetical protein VJU82_13030, partial [Acidobacteriaceae bacterium]|nr:hypothetical protein [Acidobacteriaceae bacterium]